MSSLNNYHLAISTESMGARSANVFETAARPRLETACVLVSDARLKNAPAAPYLSRLVLKLSEMKNAVPGPFVVALTAANRGDGVTFIGRSLAGALIRNVTDRIVIVDAETLGTQHCAIDPADADFGTSPKGIVYTLRQTVSSPKKWEARRLESSLAEIGSHFDWVIVDCPPLRDSDTALALAPYTNGILVVVAAEKTKRSQIAQAQRAIEFSEGVLLGFVLNKRTWPVPESLYQRL
jgi:hypothetical protein